MADLFLDAFIDSLKVFAAVVVATYFIAFIEPKLSDNIRLKGKFAPLIGVSVALLPQCGFSVVATDLYQKRHITVGTLLGVYLATSDEALPVFLSYPDKALHILPIIAFKFAIGILVGYLADLVLVKNRKAVEHHVSHCDEEYKIKLMHCDSAELASRPLPAVEECDCEDCKHLRHHHQILENGDAKGILYQYSVLKKAKDKKRGDIDRFVLKPFEHSFEIFLYVLIINFIFSIVFYFVGEDRIIAFLSDNKYLAPLFSVLIGVIPNCASSIIISELYIMGGLGFGATLGGLLMNAGVAFSVLFKKTNAFKSNLLIFATMFALSLLFGYIFSFAFSFAPLNI